MNTLLRRRLSFSPVDRFLFVFKSPYCPPEIKISLLLNRGRTDKRKTIISYFCHRDKTFQILTSTAFTFQGRGNGDIGTVDISLRLFPLQINVPSNYVHCESL